MSLFLAMPGIETLASEIAKLTHGEWKPVEVRRFPDGEDYVRITSDVAARDVFLVSRLARPGEHFLPLVFATRTLRGLGARSLILIAPYLPYLRQDRIFRKGEALSSRIFADLLGREVDLIVTVDPHLHRFASLDELYTVPTVTLSSAEVIGSWVRENVPKPVVIGPDEESRQWVERVAVIACAPWTVFGKRRHGDRDVQITAPDLDRWRSRTPVLVDDIIASGATMIEAARAILEAGLRAPYCIAVHGLFDATTCQRLHELAQEVLTTDTVPNACGRLPIAPVIAGAIRAGLRRRGPIAASSE